jgi:hypothetical protein
MRVRMLLKATREGALRVAFSPNEQGALRVLQQKLPVGNDMSSTNTHVLSLLNYSNIIEAEVTLQIDSQKPYTWICTWNKETEEALVLGKYIHETTGDTSNERVVQWSPTNADIHVSTMPPPEAGTYDGYARAASRVSAICRNEQTLLQLIDTRLVKLIELKTPSRTNQRTSASSQFLDSTSVKEDEDMFEATLFAMVHIHVMPDETYNFCPISQSLLPKRKKSDVPLSTHLFMSWAALECLQWENRMKCTSGRAFDRLSIIFGVRCTDCTHRLPALVMDRFSSKQETFCSVGFRGVYGDDYSDKRFLYTADHVYMSMDTLRLCITKLFFYKLVLFDRDLVLSNSRCSTDLLSRISNTCDHNLSRMLKLTCFK